MLRKLLTCDYERLVPIAALGMLTLIVGQALFQSLSAWLSGAELKNTIPVFEAPIANAGKALGAALTAWIPAWSVPTPVGPIDVQKTAAYIIYEWFKLPIILFLTTFGMTLLRLRVGTQWIERTLGRNDLIGAGGGTLLGMLTPVCSCTPNKQTLRRGIILPEAFLRPRCPGNARCDGSQ